MFFDRLSAVILAHSDFSFAAQTIRPEAVQRHSSEFNS